MGLFGFLRGKDERAIPEPGTPEFEALVSGTALPGSVQMGESGWAQTSAADEALKRLGVDAADAEVQSAGSQTIDLRGTGARENVEEVLRRHGIDPDKKGQTIDASTVPGLQQAIMGALGMEGLKIPNAEGFGGGISPPKVDPLAQVEYLAAKRDAGEITEAEFEAQKRRMLGG
ncbi:MAG: SHOCT domain-containing protein [Actinobacteria bacterium]|nr:SHOCT domain-containing protein [Actinomycetota bacterium]